jgi:hypothetical protein
LEGLLLSENSPFVPENNNPSIHSFPTLLLPLRVESTLLESSEVRADEDEAVGGNSMKGKNGNAHRGGRRMN